MPAKPKLTPQAPAMVDYVRPEIKKLLPRWNLVEDCVEGQMTVKDRTTKYLPKPNPDDESDANIKRYAAYIQRAVFYNVTGNTLAGLLGQVFKSDPKVELPSQLDILKTDADGAGVALTQLSQMALAFVLKFARGGVFVDYPTAAAPVTQADVAAGKIRPRIMVVNPKDVINWRTVTVGGQVLLSLVVISECYVAQDDGFAEVTETQYRVLRLLDGVYRVEIWRKDTDNKVAGGFSLFSTSVPTKGDGGFWQNIPFTFIGSDNNDPIPAKTTPLYDLAELNIAHYRNSADFEEACYMCGQPTPWCSGVTSDWVKSQWGGKLMLGSRAVIPLPKDGQAGLLEVTANSMPKEGMEHKEGQMMALGAKLIQPTDVAKTATETNINATSQTCILAQCANNVSSAFRQALEWAAVFSRVTGKSDFVLNVDFQAALSNAQDRAELVAEWQAQAITTSEMRSQLREIGVATLDDEHYQDEIDAAGPNMGLPVDPNQQTTDAANAAAAVADAKAKLKAANQPAAPVK